MTNLIDDFFGVVILFALVASFMGMLLLADGQGYKKGVDETLILCMEQPQKCKISYDYLKLQENKK